MTRLLMLGFAIACAFGGGTAQDGDSRVVRIHSVVLREAGKNRMRVELTGSGFRSDAVVHLAQFAEVTGWRYFAAELPIESAPSRMVVETGVLEPGEYAAVIRDGAGAVSPAARFGVATGSSYRLPVAAGIVTQGPNGSFSHWNRSLQAWDIAPRDSRQVVAMRAGIARTHDLGLGQMPRSHSFGNFITIDHGDGEYSHYAHLAAGTFQVRDGEQVAAGQVLAAIGNSGRTSGSGGGYHVHVHVTRSPGIASQSVPLQFNAGQSVTAPKKATAEVRGSVQVAQWWTDLLRVPPRTSSLRISLRRDAPEAGVEIHLVSPSGMHYGPDTEKLRVPEPEAGTWRISVEGMRGGFEPIAFIVDTELDRGR